MLSCVSSSCIIKVKTLTRLSRSVSGESANQSKERSKPKRECGIGVGFNPDTNPVTSCDEPARVARNRTRNTNSFPQGIYRQAQHISLRSFANALTLRRTFEKERETRTRVCECVYVTWAGTVCPAVGREWWSAAAARHPNGRQREAAVPVGQAVRQRPASTTP